MTKQPDETPVVRIGPWEIPQRWTVQRQLAPGSETQRGHYQLAIFVAEDGTPCVEENTVRPDPPLRPDETVPTDLGALARSELERKVLEVMQLAAARERGGVFIGVVDQEGNPPTGVWTGDRLDQLRPSPEAVAMEKEASTLVYGRRRGARQDPVFLEGVAKLVADRDESTSKSTMVRQVAKRFEVNEGTVWRWLREAERPK